MQISPHGYVQYKSSIFFFFFLCRFWQTVKYLKVTIWAHGVEILMWMCVYSQSKNDYSISAFSALLKRTVREDESEFCFTSECKRGLGAYNSFTLYTFLLCGWDWRSFGKWEKSSTCLNQVWTGLYIPMWLPECYRFPKHWTYFSETSLQKMLHRPIPSVWHICTVRMR